MADTFQRSCEHWSEKSRPEMDHFYTLASVDYKYLAEAFNWRDWLEVQQAEVGRRQLKLLDVACGSGKFPAALIQYARVSDADVSPIEYSLLDPSTFSLAEARESLVHPFEAGTEFEMTLQKLVCKRGEFDVVWATHALYAVPEDELEVALELFTHAMSGGAGFIAHASENAHYLRFYRHYLDGFKGGSGAPYSSAEKIMEILKKMGVCFNVEQISYENGAPEDARSQVEGYLQRCLFDDTLDLNAMQENPITGPYLETCLHNGRWQFKQNVMLFFF
ncbi:MAG: Uncharacterised protein [Gammaproteobacteria bacterium]|nr:MAG: Uncharacterised protein [Gammaproteobacteria bacterium]